MWGYQAVELRDARRCADGKLRLKVPDRPGTAIDVVQSYVHLGTHANVRLVFPERRPQVF